MGQQVPDERRAPRPLNAPDVWPEHPTSADAQFIDRETRERLAEYDDEAILSLASDPELTDEQIDAQWAREQERRRLEDELFDLMVTDDLNGLLVYGGQQKPSAERKLAEVALQQAWSGEELAQMRERLRGRMWALKRQQNIDRMRCADEHRSHVVIVTEAI